MFKKNAKGIGPVVVILILTMRKKLVFELMGNDKDTEIKQ